MKFLVHYPAVMELDIKIQYGEAMVPATKVSRMLGFEKPRMAVKDHVPCFWQYTIRDEHDQPVLYLDRSGFEALARHSCHPHKAEIWKLVLEAMDEEERQYEAGKKCQSTSQIAEEYGIPVALLNEWLCTAGIQHWVYRYWITDEKYMAGHDGQEIVWSPAGRMFLDQELKKTGIWPVK